MTSPTRPELSGTFGMVSSSHWLASGAAMAMLERGGNAFDAAVAGGLVLQIVEPHLNGPGGEVPILTYNKSSDKVSVICGQGTLPSAANIADVVSLGLNLIPGTGLLPICVPGSFGAWMKLLGEHGTLDLETVLSPAIDYALGGFRLLPRAAATIGAQRELFLNHWPTSAEVYLHHGETPRGGALWNNPLLGETYLRILKESKAHSGSREAQIERARWCFYEGFVAEAIDQYLSSAAVLDDSGGVHSGFLTGEDLASWRATDEVPLFVDYHDHRVYKTGPWGQGPVFLQQLKILEGFELAKLDPTSAEFVHLVTESAKLAFADRDAHYGDPNFTNIPIEALLSSEYASARRGLISQVASMELRPGSPTGAQPWFPDLDLILSPSSRSSSGRPPDPIGKDTCQIDVIDSKGNMIAATPSGGWLHGGPCVPSLGFSLSTRAQMTWLDASSPSPYEGGRRPRTTLSPTIAINSDGGGIAFGTPGGDQQDQWTLGFFLRRVHYGMSLQEAIDAPSFHHTHLASSFFPREAEPGHLHLESRFPTQSIAELERKGHIVSVDGDWSLGRVCAVGYQGRELIGGSDPRQDQAYSVGR